MANIAGYKAVIEAASEFGRYINNDISLDFSEVK
jgi:NAD/NADP transhydrogenase alpha subunit